MNRRPDTPLIAKPKGEEPDFATLRRSVMGRYQRTLAYLAHGNRSALRLWEIKMEKLRKTGVDPK